MKRERNVVTCLGLNHRTAQVAEREQVAYSPEELPAALAHIRDDLGSAFVLSTCNRTELYTTTDGGVSNAQRLLRALSATKDAQIAARRTYFLAHEEAVRHLFRVASGVDSMVLGESQILGQVRDALSAATQAGSLNGVLSRLVHSALRVGKRARAQTNIGRFTVSVSSAAVALAGRTLGSLADRTVLVISAGSTGELAAKALAESGAGRILVTNRTPERAAALAAEIGGQPVEFAGLASLLAETDVVISGSGAGGFILGPEQVAPAAAGRNGTDLVLIDVAVPRDIDPAVGDLPRVRLFDIDDVQEVSRAGMRGRRREVLRVEAHIEDEMADFMAWWRTLDVVPVISALRDRAESVRLRELERGLRGLSGLDGPERDRIEALTRAIVNKLLDRPIARLKDGAENGLYIEALQDLFGTRPDGRSQERP